MRLIQEDDHEGHVLQVSGRFIHLGGIDVIDGTPVLDIKPYISAYDCLQYTQCPEWCLPRNRLDEGQLRVSKVLIPDNVMTSLNVLWSKELEMKKTKFNTFGEFCDFVKGVLSRDIRSVHQRLRKEETGLKQGNYMVDMEDLELTYTIDQAKDLTLLNVTRHG